MANSELYNLVILPTSDFEAGNQTLMFSAGRRDGQQRLVSRDMPMAQVQETLSKLGLTPGQAEQLIQGNRMAMGHRSTDFLYFTEDQLTTAGLAPAAAELNGG